MELQTSRQKVVLYDNTTSPLPFLGPGSRHDFIVQHDIKELGIHNLICSTVYTAADGERRYTPETFKFTSANPLYVKTKVSFKSHVLMRSDLPYAAAPPDEHLTPTHDLVCWFFQPLYTFCCCLHTSWCTCCHCQNVLSLPRHAWENRSQDTTRPSIAISSAQD